MGRSTAPQPAFCADRPRSTTCRRVGAPIATRNARSRGTRGAAASIAAFRSSTATLGYSLVAPPRHTPSTPDSINRSINRSNVCTFKRPFASTGVATAAMTPLICGQYNAGETQIQLVNSYGGGLVNWRGHDRVDRRHALDRASNARTGCPTPARGHCPGRTTTDPLRVYLLRGRLHRSRQYRVRRKRVSTRSRVERHAVRDRSGTILPRLLPLRGPEQSDPRASRCAALDCAHHDRLGYRVDGDGIRPRRQLVLRRTHRPRDRRSRILPRGGAVPDLLDPLRGTRTHRRAVHDGGARFDHSWRPGLGRAPVAGWRARVARLAMAVSR